VSKKRQVLVTQIASEGTVKCLTVRWRKRRRESAKVIKEVVAAAFVISAELWNVLGRIGADDTGRAWICIGVNHKGVLIKRRSCRVRSRVRWRRVSTEEQIGDQAEAADPTREVPAACIESSPGNKEGVRRNVTISAEEA